MRNAEAQGREASEAAARAEEWEKKAHASDKMIAWLNKQLTAAQLAAGGDRSCAAAQGTFRFGPPPPLGPLSAPPGPFTPGSTRFGAPVSESSRDSLATTALEVEEWAPRSCSDPWLLGAGAARQATAASGGGGRGPGGTYPKAGPTVSPASVLPGRAAA